MPSPSEILCPPAFLPEGMRELSAVMASEDPLELEERVRAMDAPVLADESVLVCDLVGNGVPLRVRTHQHEELLTLEAWLSVRDRAGERVVGVLGASAWMRGGTPDVDGFEGVVLLQDLRSGEWGVLEDGALSLVVMRVLSTLGTSERAAAGVPGSLWRRWEQRVPSPAGHPRCLACTPRRPHDRPWEGTDHPQQHVAELGAGPAGGACVDQGLAPAIEALWREGIETRWGCQGNESTQADDYNAGYVAFGEAEGLKRLLGCLGARRVSEDSLGALWSVPGVAQWVRTDPDGSILRFGGESCAPLVARVCESLGAGLPLPRTSRSEDTPEREVSRG